MIQTQGKRDVHHADALEWLQLQQVLEGCSFVTSLPDLSEFPGMSLNDWKNWFQSAAELIFSRCPDDGVAIFYQTDIKVGGSWVDKGFLCQKAAEKSGVELISHKIVCRVPPGMTTFGRPAYSHLLCFSRSVRPESSVSFPDVLPEPGAVTWVRGMGVKACQLACRMVVRYTATRTIVDPFCGHGSVLSVANQMGLDAVGVDLSFKRVRKARALNL